MKKTNDMEKELRSKQDMLEHMPTDVLFPVNKIVVTYENGDVYEGFVKNNQRYGEGMMTYANGNVYEGEWKDNKHGKGKMTYIEAGFFL